MNVALAENEKAQGTNLGELSDIQNNAYNYQVNTDKTSASSPWLRCSKCNGITHCGVVESTPTRVLCCACCGSLSVNPTDLRSEFAERRRLIGGEK